MQTLVARAIILSFLGSLLLPTQGCRRSLSPDEVFRSFILDPIPASVSHLQGHFSPRHEWGAWLRFTASAGDLARIVTALDEHELGWSSFDHVTANFVDAPTDLQPPREWFRQCILYDGVSSKGVFSAIIAKPDTGEVFVSLDQT